MLVSDIMEIKRHGISLILDLFYMCTYGGQKTCWDALGLELQTTMSHCTYSRTQTKLFSKSIKLH